MGMHMFPDTHKNIVDRLTLKNIIFPGAPFLCGGAYGRRKRSASLNLSKAWSSKEYLSEEDTNSGSNGSSDWSYEGIDNKAFEEGMVFFNWQLHCIYNFFTLQGTH